MFFIFLSYISANQKVQGGKKKPNPLGSIPWDRKGASLPHFGERESGICMVKLDASVLEFRLDLGLSQGQNNTRLGIIILGLRPTWQHPLNSPGKLLRILPLPWTRFPSGSLFHRPQRRTFHLCVLTEHFMIPAGHREQARVKGEAALTRWVSSKVAGKSHRKRTLTGYSSWGWKE